MRKRFMLFLLVLAVPLAAAAGSGDPSWEAVKAAIDKHKADHLADGVQVTKITPGDEGHRWIDREVFPPAEMYTRGAWLYSTGSLGEVTRFKLYANYECIHQGACSFKSVGVPVKDESEEVSPPKKTPPIPRPPDDETVKAGLLNWIQLLNSCSECKAKLESFRFTTPLTYKHARDDGYEKVVYAGVVQVKYVLTRDEKYEVTTTTGEGPLAVTVWASKDPASLWLQSTAVDKWTVDQYEEGKGFAKDEKRVEKSDDDASDDGPSAAPARDSGSTKSSTVKKLKGLFQ